MRAFALLAALLCAAPARAAEPVWGLGLNFPGAGARLFLSPRYLAELRAGFAKGVQTYGLRGSHYLEPQGQLWPFFGVEADLLHFSGAVSDGNGAAVSAMAGAELFVSKTASVQFDLGPAYIILRDRTTSLSASGLDFVANFGVNFYFGSPSDMRDAVGALPAGPMHAEVVPLEPPPAAVAAPPAPVSAPAPVAVSTLPAPGPEAAALPASDPFQDLLAQARQSAAAGDNAAAIAAYAKALELKNDAGAHIEAAYVLEKEKKFGDAASHFKSALGALPPSDSRRVDALEQLGGLALRRGDVKEGKGRYLEAVRLYKDQGLKSPQLPAAYAGLAYCLETEGKGEAAVKNYEKALDLGADARLKSQVEARLKKLTAPPPPLKAAPEAQAGPEPQAPAEPRPEAPSQAPAQAPEPIPVDEAPPEEGQ